MKTNMQPSLKSIKDNRPKVMHAFDSSESNDVKHVSDSIRLAYEETDGSIDEVSKFLMKRYRLYRDMPFNMSYDDKE